MQREPLPQHLRSHSIARSATTRNPPAKQCSHNSAFSRPTARLQRRMRELAKQSATGEQESADRRLAAVNGPQLSAANPRRSATVPRRPAATVASCQQQQQHIPAGQRQSHRQQPRQPSGQQTTARFANSPNRRRAPDNKRHTQPEYRLVQQPPDTRLPGQLVTPDKPAPLDRVREPPAHQRLQPAPGGPKIAPLRIDHILGPNRPS